METVIERAFELAPECGTLEEIRQKLVGEGYAQVAAHLDGKYIKAQLYERLNPDKKKAHGRYGRRIR